MDARLKISKVALFECEKVVNNETKGGVNVANLVGDKIFDLQDEEYENLEHVLELNLKRKLSSSYCEDLSKLDKKETFAEALFPEVNTQGRKIISVIFGVKDSSEKSQLNTLMNEENFRFESAKFANKYLENKKKFKGILGIIQFELVSKNKIIKFVSIITTDFQIGALSTDSNLAIRDLEKVFDKNFKTIILYPFLSGRKKDIFFFDNSKARVYQKTVKSDPDILLSAELYFPDYPQKLLDELYREKHSLKEVYSSLGEDFAKKSFVKLEFCSKTIKIPFYDFYNCFDIICERKGQGLFILSKEINVRIANKNLLNENKIKKLTLKELSDKLNKIST